MEFISRLFAEGMDLNEVETSLSFSSSSTGPKYPKWLGFLCSGIAVLFFGSYMLPVKRIYSGNGIFYQWSMCLGIWCAGLAVFAYQGFPGFEPLAMLGGACWCIGNALSVPIVNLVGLALGMSIWCVANCVTGWASSFFGTLGLNKSTKDGVNIPINVSGVAVAAFSIVLFSLVQSDTGGSDQNGRDKRPINAEEEYDLLLQDQLQSSFSISDGLAKKKAAREEEERARKEAEEDGFAKCSAKLPPGVRKVVGILLAAVSGFCYGINFNPPQRLIDDGGDHSKNPLDYVFPHFTGILVTSTFIMMIYSIGAKNKPTVFPRIVFPGFIAGLMWAVAQISWFIANASLSMAVSFPIITSGPAIIASLWGIAVFHEIRGAKQILLMVGAFCITITGVVLIALSSIIKPKDK